MASDRIGNMHIVLSEDTWDSYPAFLYSEIYQFLCSLQGDFPVISVAACDKKSLIFKLSQTRHQWEGFGEKLKEKLFLVILPFLSHQVLLSPHAVFSSLICHRCFCSSVFPPSSLFTWFSVSCLLSPFPALALFLSVVELDSLFFSVASFYSFNMVLSLFLSFSPPPFCVTVFPTASLPFPSLLSSTFLASPTPSSLIFLFSNLVSCRFPLKTMNLIPPSPFSASPRATLLMPTGCTRCWLRAVPSSCHYCCSSHLLLQITCQGLSLL